MSSQKIETVRYRLTFDKHVYLYDKPIKVQVFRRNHKYSISQEEWDVLMGGGVLTGIQSGEYGKFYHWEFDLSYVREAEKITQTSEYIYINNDQKQENGSRID